MYLCHWMPNTSHRCLFQTLQVARYHKATLKDLPSVVVSDQNVSYRDDTESDSDDSGLEGVVWGLIFEFLGGKLTCWSFASNHQWVWCGNWCHMVSFGCSCLESHLNHPKQPTGLTTPATSGSTCIKHLWFHRKYINFLSKSQNFWKKKQIPTFRAKTCQNVPTDS